MSPTNHISSIRMGLWNVGGILSKHYIKAEDLLFLRQIEKFDILFLVETHVGHNSPINSIGHFYYHAICRPMSKHNNRHFGGIAILIDPLLKPHVKILKNTYHDYQWIVLDKKFFQFKSRPLYLCSV